MSTVTTTDVGREVARANAKYQPADGSCVATPSALRPLLERLHAYTEEVRDEAARHGLTSDTNVAQWNRDMANWQFRLDQYLDAIDAMPAEQQDTEAGCQTIYEMVTAPLLDGIFYAATPGIALNSDEIARIQSKSGHSTPDVSTLGHPPGHSNPKPPDVATPFSLGNQVVVYREWQAERWRLFWDDILKGANDLVTPSQWPTWVKVTLGVAGAAALSGGVYLIYRKLRPKKAPAENPKRKKRRKKKNPEDGPSEATTPPKLEVVK